MTTRALALPLLAAVLCGSLRAAELGEIKVNSHIGQQLSADIELVDLTAADLADIQARLANPDVFKGANVAMPPALGGLYISVAKRDNKRFLHLTTLQPVNADALHLFLELNSGGRQIIRAASLWLTPEPPAQRTARVAAMPASEPMPPLVAAAKPPAPAAAPPVSVDSGEAGLNEAARRAFAHRQQVAMANARERSADPAPQAVSATEAKVEAARKAEMTPSPRKSAAKPAAADAAAPAAMAAPTPAGPTPRAPAVAAASTLSCAPAKQVEAQRRQCEAMTSKLADIEGKVRRLQNAIVTPTPVPAPAAPKDEAVPAMPAAAPVKPGAAPVKPGATPVKPAVAADLAANPRQRLIMIAGGVFVGLAALGGLIYFLRKRQAKGPLKIWQSFRKKRKAEDDVPTLEDAVEVAAH
ncbi:type IV pilus assembly protein FimV [Pseudoduganella sp. HUAS MS19]